MFEDTFFKADHFVKRETYSGWVIPSSMKTRQIYNHELVFVYEGRGSVLIDKKIYTINKNDLIYIPPKVDNYVKSDNLEPLKFYGLHFSYENNQNKFAIPDITKLENPDILKNLFKEFSLIHNKKDFLYEWKENIILNQIIYYLYDYTHNKNSPANVLRVRKLIEYIQNQPYKKFTIEEFCEYTKMKKSLLIKTFKEVTGYPPLQYCQKLKLDFAKDMLISSSQVNIADISIACGFDDPLYFSRAFKKQHNCSPSNFRKMSV